MSLSKPVHSMLILGPVYKQPNCYTHPCVRHIPDMNCIVSVGGVASLYTSTDERLRVYNLYSGRNDMIADICRGCLLTRYSRRVHILRRKTPLPENYTMADVLMMDPSECYVHVDLAQNQVFDPNPGDVILFDCFGQCLHFVHHQTIGKSPLVMKPGFEAVVFLPCISDNDRFQRDVLQNPVALLQARQHIDHLFECFDVEWDVASNGLKVEWNAARHGAAERLAVLEELRHFKLTEGDCDGIAQRLVNRKRGGES